MSLSIARQGCRFLLWRVAGQVERLEAVEYPGDHPGTKEWLALIKGLIDTANEYLHRSESISLREQELIRDAGRLANMAYQCIQFFTGAGIGDLPYPVVLPMQRWLDAAGISDRSTIFRTELVANYEIRPVDRSLFDGIRDKTPALENSIKGIRWPLLRFTLPTKSFGLMPHFAIVAHEIGHEIFGRINWDLTSFGIDDRAVNQNICLRINKATLPASAVLFKQQVLLKWLQEIVSDAFGHLMTGPAFFFAICGLMQTIGAGLGISPTHPSNVLRRDMLFKKLTEPNGFAEVFEKRTGVPLVMDINSGLFEPLPSKDHLFGQLVNHLKNDEQAAVMVELPSYIEAVSDYVYSEAEKYLRGLTPDLVYTPADLDDDLSLHLENVLQAIPPIESGPTPESKKPIDFTTTLNVGWAAFLTKLDKIAVKSDGTTPMDVLRSEKLHALLIKGLELAEAKRKWEAAS